MKTKKKFATMLPGPNCHVVEAYSKKEAAKMLGVTPKKVYRFDK